MTQMEVLALPEAVKKNLAPTFLLETTLTMTQIFRSAQNDLQRRHPERSEVSPAEDDGQDSLDYFAAIHRRTMIEDPPV
jgi:hypothetical protein